MKNRFGQLVVLALAILTFASLMVATGSAEDAAGSQPAATRPELNQQDRGPGARPVGGSREQGKISDGNSDAPGLIGQWLQTLAALGLVVGLIFATRFVLRRFGAVSVMSNCDAIDIVAEKRISVRQKLLLVRLGDRLVLVGCGPEPMTTLAEVTDAAQAAELMKLIGAKGPAARSGSDAKAARQSDSGGEA